MIPYLAHIEACAQIRLGRQKGLVVAKKAFGVSKDELFRLEKEVGACTGVPGRVTQNPIWWMALLE